MNRDHKKLISKVLSFVMMLCLCVTFMPAQAFADDVQNDTTEVSEEVAVEAPEETTEAEPAAEAEEETAADVEETETAEPAAAGEESTDVAAEGDTDGEEEEPADEPEPDPVSTSTDVELNGLSLSFSKAVIDSENLPEEARPVRSWIKGYSASVKVSWSEPSDLTDVDGFIILRKTGKATVYKEIKRVSKNTTAYTDKTAKKKNTPYAFTVVAYQNTDDGVMISGPATWSAGQITTSKLKNNYKGTISATSAKLQVKGTKTLTIKVSSQSKYYLGSNRRWASSNTKVASVNSKGKVTAKGVGTATITGTLASGVQYKCKVTVVGALTPGKPTIKVDSATKSSITLVWSATSNAKSYDLYKSTDGINFKKVNVTGTTYTDKGLSEGTEYTYYMVAVNTNGEYRSESGNSNVVNQKAVLKRHTTTLTGFPTKASPRAKTTYSVKVKINPPDGRKASLQMKSGKKWVTKKVINLPTAKTTKTVTIKFPNNWWKEKTQWRLVVPKNGKNTEVTTKTLTITPKRYYQNPSSYVQISNTISKHGYSYYTSPVLVNNTSTRADHVNALIKTARKYLGDKHVNNKAGKPGAGIDASGLVMQACYGAGVDLWPVNPHRHASGAYTNEAKNIASLSKLKTVSYSNRQKGDLIFFYTGKNLVGHVAIYLGNNKIIHANFVDNKVVESTIDSKYGTVYTVKRIFN